MPKQKGYPRIDVPKTHTYTSQQISSVCTFDMSTLAQSQVKKEDQNALWINLAYPQWKGNIYLSYFVLNDTNLVGLTEDSRRFAYKHTVRATAIEESVFSLPKKKVHGMIFDVDGDAASSVQFYATDSTKHYLMGSLYFNTVPNRDSLNPVINYIRQDILHLIETLTWE